MKILARAAILIFLLDQASKYLVIQIMGLREYGELDVLPPFLNLRMTWNSGINFGLLDGAGRWVWISLAVIISGWVLLWALRENLGRYALISAGLLIGGALGNALDRVIYGAVADFLNMSCCGIENPFAFNIADVGVFAGALGLVVFSGQPKSKRKTS